MSSLKLRRVPGTQEFVAVRSRCHGCSGCGVRTAGLSLQTPSEEVMLGMTTGNQLSLLWNSLGKPLVILVLIAMGCEFFGITGNWSIAASVVGFTIGVLLCRTMPETVLEKTIV